MVLNKVIIKVREVSRVRKSIGKERVKAISPIVIPQMLNNFEMKLLTLQ